VDGEPGSNIISDGWEELVLVPHRVKEEQRRPRRRDAEHESALTRCETAIRHDLSFVMGLDERSAAGAVQKARIKQVGA
jgi:hypothetical protein